jgi:hypothetical protein
VKAKIPATWSALAWLCAALVFASPAFSQAKADKGQFEPQVGQPGKDVVWVPTPDGVIERMLDMARATPKDFLVDLGSGDGRTVIAAAKRGIRAMGVEYNPDMVALSNREAQRQGVSHMVKFINGDIFATDFSQATVLTLYLLPSLNVKLRPTILDMKPGTRVVSHAFNMAEWDPDESATPEGRQVFLWIVPAKVGGTWSLQQTGQSRDLTLQQTFQKIQGTLRAGAQSLPLFDARLRGDEIAFTVVENSVRHDFTGRVQGKRMTGMVRGGGQADGAWSATRR